MGLAERKVKQRIGHDPRNLSWSGDTNRFSYRHMTALGWSGDKGLGANADGNPNHIAVARKLDNGGIGMARARKEGDDNAAGAGQAGRGLEDVLKRLAAASASATPSPAPESPAESSDKEQKKRNKIASRQRHLQSKRLASSSPAALAEILGVPISSLPASPSSSAPGTPAESTPEPDTPAETLDPETDRTAEETVKKSTLSVADYFKQKMREKMLARQAAAAANGTAPVELAADSLAALKEDKPKVAIGGVAWEGSKMAFDEEKVDLGDLGTEAGPSTSATPEVDGKAAKKAKKEAKRLKKLPESASASPAPPAATGDETSVADAEAKAKREKKERKEEKKRKRDEEEAEVKDEGKKDKKDKKRKRDDDSGEKKSKKDKERKSKE